MIGILLELTEYSTEILDYVFKEYCDPQTPITQPKDLWNCYQFIHQDVIRHQLFVLNISSWTLHEKVIPNISFLATQMDEIHWGDRLSPWNHAYHFPFYVTGDI